MIINFRGYTDTLFKDLTCSSLWIKLEKYRWNCRRPSETFDLRDY